MARVLLDPGHGGKDPGARAVNGRYEAESNLRVALLARPLVAAAGHEVQLTREADVTVDLAQRVALANSWLADVVVSLHADASSNPATKGHHAIRSIHARPGEGGDKLANLLVDKLTEATGRPPFSRRVWSRPSESQPGRDYYAIIRETAMPAVILERGFLTNAEDAALLFCEEFLRRQAEGIATAVAAYFGGQERAGTPIAGPALVGRDQAKLWASQRGATKDFVWLADLYWEWAPLFGIRPEVAYAQAAKETAFGRFGGGVDRSFNNWCGLKTRQGGPNSDPNAHARFASDYEGVWAHLQHLARYAGLPNPPDVPLVDPRYELVKPGSAKTVEELGGKWAPSPDYGRSIVRDYLEPMMATPQAGPGPQEQAVPLEEYRKVVDELEDLRERLARIRELANV